jgi:peptidyl-tRNA hydrolase
VGRERAKNKFHFYVLKDLSRVEKATHQKLIRKNKGIF